MKKPLPMATNGSSVYKNGNNIATWAGVIVAGAIALLSIFLQSGQSNKGDINQVRQESREDMRRSEERTDRDISHIKETISNKLLTTSEHQEFVRRTDKTADNLRDEINRIRADQVTRSEHIQHWNEIAERLNALNLRIKDVSAEQNAANESMRKEFGSSWTLSDQMKNIQDQIKQLQQQLNALPKGGSLVAPTTAGVDPTRIR